MVDNERINAIKKYLDYFPYSTEANNNLLLCQYADELDIKLNGSYYPRLDYKTFVINDQIKAGKNFRISNSSINYEYNGIDTLVVWSESCGRLAFVDDKYWYNVEDEWNDFQDILLSYNPLDYDTVNCRYIYNITQGKKLINDYPQIIEEFETKLKNKIKLIDIEHKQKELERLQKELQEVERKGTE